MLKTGGNLPSTMERMPSTKGHASHPSAVRAYAQKAPLIVRLSYPSSMVQLKIQ